ncbi:hypothetical protein BH09PAT3_BH09PAT3_2970 [soil metagenome]
MSENQPVRHIIQSIRRPLVNTVWLDELKRTSRKKYQDAFIFDTQRPSLNVVTKASLRAVSGLTYKELQSVHKALPESFNEELEVETTGLSYFGGRKGGVLMVRLATDPRVISEHQAAMTALEAHGIGPDDDSFGLSIGVGHVNLPEAATKNIAQLALGDILPPVVTIGPGSIPTRK